MNLAGITRLGRVLAALQVTVAKIRTAPPDRLDASEFISALGEAAGRLAARICEEHTVARSHRLRFATAVKQLADGLFRASNRCVIRAENKSKEGFLAILVGALSLWPGSEPVHFPGGLPALTAVLEESALLVQQAAIVASEGKQVSFFRQAVDAGQPIVVQVEILKIRARLLQIVIPWSVEWGDMGGMVCEINYFLQKIACGLDDVEVARGLLTIATSLDAFLKILEQESVGHRPGQLEILDRLYRVIFTELRSIKQRLSLVFESSDVGLKRRVVGELLGKVAMIERALQPSTLCEVQAERRHKLTRIPTQPGLSVRPRMSPDPIRWLLDKIGSEAPALRRSLSGALVVTLSGVLLPDLGEDWPAFLRLVARHVRNRWGGEGVLLRLQGQIGTTWLELEIEKIRDQDLVEIAISGGDVSLRSEMNRCLPRELAF